MAQFASTEQAKKIANDADEEIKPEAKKLKTTEVSSLLNLRSELSKRMNDVVKPSLPDEYSFKGKSAVLGFKKDEKKQIKNEGLKRKKIISSLEEKMRREDEEALNKSRQRMIEKSVLYDKLVSGTMYTHTDESPVEFMVDFSKKTKDDIKPVHNIQPTTSKNPEPEHYIPNDEQRVYGAGHIIFSTNEETRQQEINRVKAASKQTEISRQKARKEQLESARLQHEKSNRLRRQMGLPEVKEPSPPLEEPELLIERVPEDRPSEPQEVSFEAETLKRIHSERDWDRGKSRYTQWIEKQRSERDEDFQPPSFYYKKDI